MVEQLGESATSALRDDDADGTRLAVAFPGPFDYRRGRSQIRGQRKLDSIYGVDLIDALRRVCERPNLSVRFCNDADAAAWGEASCGAGRPFERFLMVTLGTGFGASLVDRSSASRPQLDDNVAGLLYQEPVADRGRADDILSAFGLAGFLDVAPSDIAAEADRARRGDERSGEAFAEFGRIIGIFLREVAAVLDVDAIDSIVVGGGVSAAFDLFGPALADSFGGDAVRSKLGGTAALFGAALLFGD